MSEAPELTPEQKVSNVKQLLMNNMGQFYSQLVGFVKQLPIDEKLKEFAVMNLDQGVMWVEQGVKKLQFSVQETPLEKPQDSAPPAPPVPPVPTGDEPAPDANQPEGA